jgi:hypothetical protein
LLVAVTVVVVVVCCCCCCCCCCGKQPHEASIVPESSIVPSHASCFQTAHTGIHFANGLFVLAKELHLLPIRRLFIQNTPDGMTAVQSCCHDGNSAESAVPRVADLIVELADYMFAVEAERSSSVRLRRVVGLALPRTGFDTRY